MKKKTLSILFCFLVPAISLMAQSPKGLIPCPTADEIRQESFFDLQFVHSVNNHAVLKPTADKQRLIASTIVNDSTGTLMLRDTALFTYSGLRGSGPSAQTGNVTVLSDFDTSYAYVITDNFAAPVPRASKKYDAESRLLFFYNYSNDGETIYREWNEYYSTDTFKKSGSWKKINATDYVYKDRQFNAAGKVLVDTFSQVVPSIPGGAYNWDRITNYEYDNQSRKISGTRITNSYGTGGNVQTIYYDTWYFYENSTQILPSRDSAILILFNNGSPQPPMILEANYTYDASNNLTLVETYSGNPQTISSRTTNVYDAGGKLLTSINEYFDNIQWHFSSKTENQYDNNVLIKSAVFNYDDNSSAWTEQSKTVYHLNGSNLVDSMAFYNSNLISTTTYTYNNFKNIVEQKQTSYDNNNVAHTSITHNYYTVFDDGTVETGIENTHNGNLTVNVFPNPASDYIDINIEDWKGTATISISNLNGTVLGNETISTAHTKIDFSRYAAGIYFIKVSSKEGTSIKKIVKH